MQGGAKAQTAKEFHVKDFESGAYHDDDDDGELERDHAAILENLRNILFSDAPGAGEAVAPVAKEPESGHSSKNDDADGRKTPMDIGDDQSANMDGDPTDSLHHFISAEALVVFDAGFRGGAGVSNAPSQPTIDSMSPTREAGAIVPRDVARFSERLSNGEVCIGSRTACEFEMHLFSDKDESQNRRLKGSLSMPYPYTDCACGCASRNNKTRAPRFVMTCGGLSAFWPTGWLPDGALVFVRIGAWTPAQGRIIVNAISDRADGATLHIQDMVTNSLHCCPVSWVWEVYSRLRISGVIPEADPINTSVLEHLSARTGAFRFVYTEHNANLHQLAILFRHCLGMQAMSSSKPPKSGAGVGGASNSRSYINKSLIKDTTFTPVADVAPLFVCPENPPHDDSEEICDKMFRDRILHFEGILSVHQWLFVIFAMVSGKGGVVGPILNGSADWNTSRDICKFIHHLADLAQNPVLLLTDGAGTEGQHGCHPSQPAADPSEPANSYGSRYPNVSSIQALMQECSPPCSDPDDTNIAPELAYFDAGWLTSEDVLIVRIPGLPHSAGLVYVTQSGNNTGDRVIRIHDLTMAAQFCCVKAWVRGIIMYHVWRGTMPDTSARAAEARMMFRSKSGLDSRVTVMRLGLTLADLYTVFKDSFLLMESARRGRGASAPSIVDYLPPIREVVARFESMSQPRFSVTKQWQETYCVRLASIREEIVHIRRGITALCQGTSIAELSWRITNMPIHEMVTPEDALSYFYHFVNVVDRA